MSAPDAVAPWVTRQLHALLAQPGHALLLHGPSGLGQFELAWQLARAWLCEAPTPEGACGACPACHGMDVHTHPDFFLLMPEEELLARGLPLPEKAQAELDAKKRKPSRDIRIDDMRAATTFAQRTRARERGKVVLIYPAERMNHAAAGALLKTLEEPPGEVRFILASDAAHMLLPTIRSRCMARALHRPGEEEALAWLGECGLPQAEAAALLRAAGGRPEQALALAATDDAPRGKNAPSLQQSAAAQAAQWAALPAALAQGETAALAATPLPETVARLQKLCHDLMCVQVGAAPRFFDAANLPRRPLSFMALARWQQQLARLARHAAHPFNAPLAAEFLASAAQQALHSRP
ncbi:MAG: DNA polymerase III subunit delta' [Ottowia sp.]|nr:DNA polymerase III subunit delta' [Ottowia sp.]